MALPSQYVASSSRRSHMYRRSARGRLRRRAGIIGTVAVTGAVIWWFRPFGFGGGSMAPAPDAGEGTILTGGSGPGSGDGAGADSTTLAGPPLASEERDAPSGARVPAAIPPDRRSPLPGRAGGSGSPSQPEGAAIAGRIPDPAPVRSPVAAGSPTPDMLEAREAAASMLERLEQAPIAMRDALSELLINEELHPDDASAVRAHLAKLNERMVFSRHIEPNDPFTVDHRLEGSDRLSRMRSKYGWQVDYTILAQVNNMTNPNLIVAGRRFKGLRGPFHAVVTKQSFRVDIWMGDPITGPFVYVRSFPIGIGKENRTPVGRFRVTETTTNPEWWSPEDGTYYAPNDEDNPIGEHWVGIIGDDPSDSNVDGLRGFGIHGTIDPESIGRARSLGCVRLGDGDVDMVWGLLRSGSYVVIREFDGEPANFDR